MAERISRGPSIAPLVAIPAEASEVAAIAAALEGAALPADDVTAPGVRLFTFRSGGEIVGYGGFEPHGPDALLRSIVVQPPRRGRGIGRAIVESLLDRAAADGARTAFLLTQTARGFFETLGFVAIDRAAAPAAIRATRQMTALCPSSATLLVRAIP